MLQNAIRKKTEALNFLRLASRLDAVVSRLDTQVCALSIWYLHHLVVASIDLSDNHN